MAPSHPSPSLGTALITGASSGIGAVYADRLARRGHALILVARDAQRLAEQAVQLQRDIGRPVDVLVADLTQREGQEKVAQRLREDAQISLLVNNAGAGTHLPLLESDVERMAQMIELNITALMRLSHAVVPGLVARGGGAVINISSIVSLAPELLNGVYGGSKAFVTAFSRSLHHELSARGVRVQAVLPGATATPFWAKGGLPVEHLPPEMVMGAEPMVDAALRGFDRGELITVPSLHSEAALQAYETARAALLPQLSANTPAPRYQTAD